MNIDTMNDKFSNELDVYKDENGVTIVLNNLYGDSISFYFEKKEQLDTFIDNLRK